MVLTPVKTPLLVKRMFPNYIWDIPTTNKTIYLTFDDGPTPEITNWTLNVLKQYDAKASFFCIGNNIEEHPRIFQDILNGGHVIGNHTHNHIKGWKTKTKDYLNNISEAQNVINSQITNSKNSELRTQNSELFRPPYGQIKPKQGKKLIELGYKIIMWNVLSFDWDAKVSPKNCLNNVISKTTNGSIIVFHDSIKASKNMKYALPKVLEYFSGKGYRFESLS
ncbi:polysaccharide deacetylase family protein [Sabulilitoribacter arenilitoris]|uniref:Polysaccharide deacetylase family protein n=1 Tax=Wocania arenilitoris TaxID=2044858 RepID=A0AAE3ELA2_9FLAO|nr:polysaccharide deacetylase family protein [Wocania arenilitoris]MCF7567455.1 polysaccharide deacetylase family protein [Wocania arenilitoris]